MGGKSTPSDTNRDIEQTTPTLPSPLEGEERGGGAPFHSSFLVGNGSLNVSSPLVGEDKGEGDSIQQSPNHQITTSAHHQILP